MITLYIALLLITAYLIGSIPTSIIIGRLFYKMDIREHGSGNAGATNVVRVLGWKAGIPVMLVDVLKGWFAVYMTIFVCPCMMTPDQFVYLRIGMAAAVVLGHVFPVYAGFRGGKGVATLLGIGIALYPYSVWVILVIFLVIVISTRYVSVASITVAISFPFIENFIFRQQNTGLVILSIAVAVFVPLTHWKNIRRLIRGEEKRFRVKSE
jgi:glycerol-3-phosphate acyltransferase PlsY